MKIKGIKFVASGHQPHCTTVPLIYKQDEVIFIANDTSNGYRPERNAEKLSLKNIPLSFIEIKNDGTFECGICAIEPIIDIVSQGKVTGMKFIKASDKNEIKGLSKDGTNDDYYEKLITTYENLEDIPFVVEKNGEKILKDKNNETLLFVNKKFKFYPLTTELTTELTTGLTPGGGKRKSKKNSKKSRRRSKRGKRTHKCLHGCKHR
jgi:hypothetical protein